MKVDSYQTKTLHEGGYTVSNDGDTVIVRLGDEHAIALSVDEARTLALSLGLEVLKAAQGGGF